MIIKIKVYPSSGREDIEKVGIDSYKVHLKKPAVDGKANEELIKFLKKQFKVDVKIIKGMKSRDKIVKIGD